MGMVARFQQVDTTVESFGSTPGSVTSVLQIVSALLSDTGSYICTGSSSANGVQVSSSYDSTVVVVQIPNPGIQIYTL